MAKEKRHRIICTKPQDLLEAQLSEPFHMFKAHDIAKKQHRERAQPSDRRKLGLLEKKKDYRERAQDFHRKQAHLKLLREKAEQANEDEFDYGMIKARTENGILAKEQHTAKPLSEEAMKLLRTQDAGYIRTLESQERKKVERLKKSLALRSHGKHTVFVDSERELRDFDAAKHFNTLPELLQSRENRIRLEQLENPEFLAADLSTAAKQGDEKLAQLRELRKRIERQKELTALRHEVETERELLKKGDRKKIIGPNHQVIYEWESVRKR